jgi:hypothetical protein
MGGGTVLDACLHPPNAACHQFCVFRLPSAKNSGLILQKADEVGWQLSSPMSRGLLLRDNGRKQTRQRWEDNLREAPNNVSRAYPAITGWG